jgi:hypothetical protein
MEASLERSVEETLEEETPGAVVDGMTPSLA